MAITLREAAAATKTAKASLRKWLAEAGIQPESLGRSYVLDAETVLKLVAAKRRKAA